MIASVNNKPALEFSFKGGNLIVEDVLEEYRDLDLTNYVCIDCILKDDQLSNVSIIENIISENDLKEASFALPEDGMHAFYRILIPRIKKYVLDGKLEKYSFFYYKQKVYYNTENLDTIDLSKCIEVEIKDLFNLLDSGAWVEGNNDAVYVKYYVFSYELLKKAFVEAEQTYEDSKKQNHKVDKELQYKRNVLLSALLLIREYISSYQHREASELLDSLEGAECLGLFLRDSDNSKCECTSKIKFEGIKYLNPIQGDDLVRDYWVFGDMFPIKLF